LFHTNKSLTLGLFDIFTFLDYKFGRVQFFADILSDIRKNTICVGDCYQYILLGKEILVEVEDKDEAIQLIIDHIDLNNGKHAKFGPESGHCCNEFVRK